jgi:hypothetical protein
MLLTKISLYVSVIVEGQRETNMLNGVTKKERLERTLSGIGDQMEDFFFIIEDYVRGLSEKKLKDLYELEEDL